MDKIWNMTIDFFAKVNNWIPLVTVLWAGIGLIAVTLALAITGYALRKRLVQQWLIWTYFIFATVLIFAQADGDIFTVVAHMEVPCLVVLLCYLLRLVFYRRPRYTYVERAVYAREIDKTPVVKEVKVKNEKKDDAREVETTVVEEVTVQEVTLDDAQDENTKDEVLASEVEEKNDEKVAEEKEDKKEEKIAEEKEEKTEVTTTVDMPAVEPIPDKSYEAPREPGIVTTPVTEKIPELKPSLAASRPSMTATRSTSASSLTSANRTATSSTLAARPSTLATNTTANRTATATTSTAARPNAFASMYSPRTVKTTTTTTTTTTTNTNTSANTLNASSAVRATSGVTASVNRTAAATNGTAKNPRSTEDIMAAIARLRASMKK